MKSTDIQGWSPSTTAPVGVFVTVIDDIRYADTPFSRYFAIKGNGGWKNVHGVNVAPSYWLNTNKVIDNAVKSQPSLAYKEYIGEPNFLGEYPEIMILCGTLGPHCQSPGCLFRAVNLCDCVVSGGETCDRLLCARHSFEVATNVHYCSFHIKQHTQKPDSKSNRRRAR